MVPQRLTRLAVLIKVDVCVCECVYFIVIETTNQYAVRLHIAQAIH